MMGNLCRSRALSSKYREDRPASRYFLEPLGVSVDKWSIGARGRVANLYFADVFELTSTILIGELIGQLSSDLGPGFTDTQLVSAVNSTLSSLPCLALFLPLPMCNEFLTKAVSSAMVD